LWDGGWFGGHHLPGYSVLFPPLEGWLGPREAGALGAVAAVALFAALAREHWGPTTGARLASAWFALGAVTLLLSGRLVFAFGLAFGLGALLALARGRHALALALGVATALASPVAALFLALAGVAAATRPGLGLAVAALAPVAVLAVAFPEGGTEPFAFSAFWPAPLLAAGVLLLAPRRERALRRGAILYAVGAVVLVIAATPVGGNWVRIGPLLAGPLAAGVLLPRRAKALAVLALPLLAWQWSAAARDVEAARGDPSTHAGYYAGLLRFLERSPGPPGRIEVAFTRNHWEAAEVAPRVPLARGWERQLDRRHDDLFYRPLTAAAYRRWLAELAVRWVALPDVELDPSARDEARLLRAGLPGLRPAWRDAHWRVWEVVRPAPLARGAGRVVSARSDALALRARAAGRSTIQVRWTPYWAVVGAPGCVERAPGGWTAVSLRRPGRVRLVTRFAIGRVGATRPRCSAG
jgi:hypothetical protein